MPEGHHFELDGVIGLGLCNHDICMCGQTFTDVYGYQRTVVPHSGVWVVVPDEEE